MTKAELIERIARSRSLPPDITKKEIAQVVALAFEEIALYFGKAKVTRSMSPRFTFPRFGTFTKKRRNARRGVNPRTLEPMQIDAFHTLDFKASRELREAMNGGSGSSTTAAASRPGTTEASGRKDAGKPASKRATGGGTKRKSTRTAASTVEGSKRRLTPRDEDAELDALIDDEALFDDDREDAGEGELPESPLQRVKGGPSNSRARTG